MKRFIEFELFSNNFVSLLVLENIRVMMFCRFLLESAQREAVPV